MEKPLRNVAPQRTNFEEAIMADREAARSRVPTVKPRGVVRKLGQGHCGGQAFVAKELLEPSLPLSSGSVMLSASIVNSFKAVR